MKKLVLLLIIAFVFTSYNNCVAQGLLNKISNKAKNKIEERINKKVEEKVDERIDEEIDKKLDEAYEDNDSTSTESKKSREERDNERVKNIMSRMGVNSTPVEIEDSYSFSSNIKMDIETYKDNKLENTGHINSFFNNDNNVFAYEFEDAESSTDKKGFFIFDQKNKASIILTDADGEKKGIVTGIDMTQLGAYAQENMDVDSDNIAFSGNTKSTGRTKKILGYNCEEYVYEDENEKSNVWLTKDKVWKTQNLYSSLNINAGIINGFSGGFVMEAESMDKTTNEKSIMKITEINEKINKKIDLSTYEIMNMGSF